MKGYCDTCQRENRSDIISMGKDANGDPDAPDMCFICRVEYSRKRIYNKETKKYIREE